MKTWLVASLLLNVLLAGAGIVAFLQIPSALDSRRSAKSERLTSQFEVTPNRPGAVVFVGDSITEGGLWAELFPGVEVLNRGVGGDTTGQLLDRIEQVHALAPRQLFLMIGINDLNRGVPLDETFSNLSALFDGFDREIPKTAVFLQSVLPLNEDWWIEVDPEDIDALNRRLMAEASARGYEFVDLRPVFTADEGHLLRSLSNDGIHLLGAGYARWRDQIAPLVQSPAAASQAGRGGPAPVPD